MQVNVPRLIFAGLLSLYFLWIAYDPMQGSFLDNVDLPIHETGHLISRPFGEFLMVAGGSLFQVILPVVFLGYFLWRKQYYAAAIVGLWVGQSILNVWVYAADAVRMQLVLTSGFTGSEGSFHDWNYMLERTGLLNSTNKVAGLIRFVGTLTILASGAAAVYFALRSEPPIDEE
jgi:hypothetical protein